MSATITVRNLKEFPSLIKTRENVEWNWNSYARSRNYCGGM